MDIRGTGGNLLTTNLMVDFRYPILYPSRFSLLLRMSPFNLRRAQAYRAGLSFEP